MADKKHGTLDPKEYDLNGNQPWLKPHPWDADRPRLPSMVGFWKRVIDLDLTHDLESSLEVTVDCLRRYWQDIEPNYGSADFIDMANGGYGVTMRHKRAYIYPEWTDEMFQIVCDYLGWSWKTNENV